MPASAEEYSTKDPAYFGAVRTDILQLLGGPNGRVLEIGCGTGDTLAFLKAQGLCSWTAGVELFPSAASIARDRVDRLFEGNIETMDIDLEPGSIDAILCLDVLEHLIDPWAVVRKLDRLLRPGGILIASIPNVRHVKVLAPLILRGRWDYADSGLLDRTHLRFFVRDTAIALLESSGLQVDAVRANGPLVPGSMLALLNKLTFSLFQGFLDFQYLIRARKASGPGSAGTGRED
ncbi:MAG TPA: class I SAM-dependent methyltransferase [Gemmatimonadales bacterium]|nr:class I SAM-dependent methyltransferase [Gemmatimonadales bacterium]